MAQGRVKDEVIVESYDRHKSVYAVGKEVGLNHSSVHERLVKLGVMLSHSKWTEDESDRLQRDYLIHRDAGKLDLLATDMGRTKQFICRQAKRLGLTNYNHIRPYMGVWKYITEDVARGIFEKFKKSSLGLGQFCAKMKYDDLGFSRTMREFFPDEWEHVIEAKVPKQTMYRYGRAFEYRVRDGLRHLGYFVLRSPRSASPTDLVAIRSGEVLMVQCKRGGQIGVREWNALYDLALSCGSVPILAMNPTNRQTLFFRLIGRKDGSKRRQPMEPFEIQIPPLPGTLEAVTV
jgi:Holliday junction resolvase